MTLTVERLREILAYDPDTGVFTWKESRGRVAAGSVAGGLDGDGYTLIRVDGCKQRAHRLAWLYVYGVWPDAQVDHENEIKTDNRISNLRPATDAQNKQNQSKPHRNNTSGYLGVTLHRKSGKWQSRIRIGGKDQWLGLFSDPKQASEIYLSAKAASHSFWLEGEG